MSRSTVGELKRLLMTLPDDTPLVMDEEAITDYCGLPEAKEMFELKFEDIGGTSIISCEDYERYKNSYITHVVLRKFMALII